MIRKVLKTISVTYCDVCGEICYSYSTHRLTDGTEYHACSKYHEGINKTCMNILYEGLINKNFTPHVPLLNENMLDAYVTLRPSVQKFAEEMERKLKLNDHKGGWMGMSQDEIIQDIREENIELSMAIANNDVKNILEECADIANYLMMLAEISASK